MWWMTARAGALVLEPRAGRQIEGEEGREDGWGRRQGRLFFRAWPICYHAERSATAT